MKKYKNHNPRFIKIILTISLNFNSFISKNNILNNILKYVSKNDNNFLFLFSCSVQYLLLLPRKISLMILLSIQYRNQSELYLLNQIWVHSLIDVSCFICVSTFDYSLHSLKCSLLHYHRDGDFLFFVGDCVGSACVLVDEVFFGKFSSSLRVTSIAFAPQAEMKLTNMFANEIGFTLILLLPFRYVLMSPMFS